MCCLQSLFYVLIIDDDYNGLLLKLPGMSNHRALPYCFCVYSILPYFLINVLLFFPRLVLSSLFVCVI